MTADLLVHPDPAPVGGDDDGLPAWEPADLEPIPADELGEAGA